MSKKVKTPLVGENYFFFDKSVEQNENSIKYQNLDQKMSEEEKEKIEAKKISKKKKNKIKNKKHQFKKSYTKSLNTKPKYKKFDTKVSKKKVEEETKKYDELEKMVFGHEEEEVEEKIDQFLSFEQKNINIILENMEPKAKWKDDQDPLITNNSSQPFWAQKAHEECNNKIKFGQNKKKKSKSKLIDDEEEEDGSEITWETGNVIEKNIKLSPHVISFSKLSPLNKDKPTVGKARVLEFMNRAQVAMVAGADSKLNLFQVDGKTNSQIQSIAIEKFPIFSAKFLNNESSILIGSQWPSFVTYDMMAGKVLKTSLKDLDHVVNTKKFVVSPSNQFIALRVKHGFIQILNSFSKGWIMSLKVEDESVEGMCFSKDSQYLYTYSKSAVINIFCTRTWKCIYRFQDNGALQASSIQISPCGKYLATGCTSGIVNFYNNELLEKDLINNNNNNNNIYQPLKSIKNLTTSCSLLSFNSSSELVAMASDQLENSYKLLHLQSMTVFSNIPPPFSSNGFIQSLAFSPNSGYFALGNHKGLVSLFRLKYYTDY